MGDTETKMTSYEDQLQAEVATWCIADPIERAEKMQRERIRHPKLIRDLLLDKLDTGVMNVLEVGGGPEPVSDLLPFAERLVVDPCSREYGRYFPVPDHITLPAEQLDQTDYFNLAICTNALDHVEMPVVVVRKIMEALVPGGFFAVMCAENNAITNPHPCHTINLTARDIHRWCDEWAETVWELTYAKDGYRYGWATYAGKVGQPAFAMLLRKVTGYDGR